MAKKKIGISLSAKSIDDAIKQIEKYTAWVQRKTTELTQKLAEIGQKEASVRFFGAMYSGANDVEVSIEPTPEGYAIIAAGQAVCFIEFGAGVYYNGAGDYPLARPTGVVGIAQYGKGKGSQNTWGFYGEGGELVMTHGTPAAMPLYHASVVMRNDLLRIAKEVFASD